MLKILNGNVYDDDELLDELTSYADVPSSMYHGIPLKQVPGKGTRVTVSTTLMITVTYEI